MRTPGFLKAGLGAAIALSMLAAACGSDDGNEGDDSADTADTTAVAGPEASTGAGLSGEIDITDGILTNTSADCGDYDVALTATVDDITRDIMFDSGVTITVGDESCTLDSNNIPNHDFNDESARFATDVSEQARTFEIVRDPERADKASALSQTAYDGVFLNGVPIDLLSAGCYRPDDAMANEEGIVPIGCTPDDPWLANPLGTEDKFGADAHNAHTQPDGGYHYHGNPLALFDDDPGPAGSPVIGWAADGFPIYGSYFLDPESGEVRKAVSGYTVRDGDRPDGAENPPGAYDGTYYDDFEFTGAAGDLDECNGMEVDGQYGYYVTDEFPYLMFCLSGTADASFDKGVGGGAPADGAGPPGDGAATAGAPDLTDAAADLGVTVDELAGALGPPPPDLDAAATALGVTVAELEAVLPAP